MKKFTKKELLFILRIMTAVEKNKTASLPYNIVAQAGYKSVPKELEQVVEKLSDESLGLETLSH